IKDALGAGIIPVLLVGEREKEESIENILSDQLEKDLAGLFPEQVSKILFAYEPVWAISTNPGGEADTPENAVRAIGLIQQFLSDKYGLSPSPQLYGGSINENNVAEFLKHSEIKGAVIGGASLRAEEFGNILKIASDIKT
ncbi:MAG: triose-phosphate isomerase, partial [Candidatus Taylorbacteria bacterium]|nr:triose-phosphate isomerase [Candidatus Taylorbacteria bacterium]